jgi:hypothetical protein
MVLAVLMSQSCKREKRIYKSNCDIDKGFTHLTFKQLMDSIDNYDQQYIEVSGKYEEGKGISALTDDSTIFDRTETGALWVNFSQDCPLYLAGTHRGLFEYNDGRFTQINNKEITIRGVIALRNKGRHKKYKAAIERVSLVKI